jgi:tubulin--tyrosine ligase
MRKIDIRIYGLAQIIDGIHFRGYFYKEGYVRTSSYKYSTTDLTDKDVHLTNDAVQVDCEDYSKYEQGNKASFKDFAAYLKNLKGVDFYEVIVPKMRQSIQDTLEAFWQRLQKINRHNPENRE